MPRVDGNIVRVEAGDTLWSIAEDFLGAGNRYKWLATTNGIADPNKLTIGQEIDLSGSGTTTTQTKTEPNCPTITNFGLLSTSTDTLYATWMWPKESQTKCYKVLWKYVTVDGVTLVGDSSEISVDEEVPTLSRQDTYQIPSGATSVYFKVKPISKTKSATSTKTYFTADWSVEKSYRVETPLDPPGQPSLSRSGLKLTAELNNLDAKITGVQFRLVKNKNTVVNTTKTISVNPETKYVSYVWNPVDEGSNYMVCCRAVKGSLYSEWSNYSNVVDTIPFPPSIIDCRATDRTTVYITWTASETAAKYEIEYTDKKEYFDASGEITPITTEGTGYYITGMTSGGEYFFRVRAVNDAGNSDWTDVVSLVMGTSPSAPTTWSSTTTAIVGEVVNLYWVHNSQDGSSETYAEIEIYDGENLIVSETIENTAEGEDKDLTKYYALNTELFSDVTSIQWRVRTAGITRDPGAWSVERVVDIYDEPTLKLRITDSDGNELTEIKSFPFYISAVPGPDSQNPIGYHVSVTADGSYESVDAVGNIVTINAGDEVYSEYFDTNYDLSIRMSAEDIDLEKNITYSITVTVTMNSGLNAESSVSLPVTWTEVIYSPNASVEVDTDTYTAYITPYCENRRTAYRQVVFESDTYVLTDTDLGYVYGEPVPGAYTTTGERVYSGVDINDNEVYFCVVEATTRVENVLLSVYRREFDGSFTEIATGLDGGRNTTVTDPHPALDYARYRIVATSIDTGAVGYYDMPGHDVGGKAIIIQWDEAWTSFEVSEDAELAQPAWSGSMLKLPYNINVSDSHSPDVSLVNYVGRSRPVSYYGTHLGESSSWSVDIDKSDKETLYALRRLAIWMGDVYVREPSGSGYWAHIVVGFSQKHRELTIPVTLTITRVEGGM